MEEDENKTDVRDGLPSEENVLPPEEVLERAKKENEKLGDERQRGRMVWSSYAGFIAMVFTAVAVLMIMTFALNRYPVELNIILFTGIAAQYIAQACVCPKKRRVFFAVTGAIIAACVATEWVLWILELCGHAV